MGYERNEWVKKAIQEVNLEKLKAFENRLKGATLAEVLDYESLSAFARLSAEDEEKTEKEFPGIAGRVSLESALMERNLWLLEKNKNTYFKDGWEKKVKNILFLPDHSFIYWDTHLYEDGYAEKLYMVLKWIEDNTGKLPEIDGISELCSKFEMADQIQLEFSDQPKEIEKKNVEAIRMIRRLLNDKRLVVDTLEIYKRNGLERFDYSSYDEISVLYKSIGEKNSRTLICILRGNVACDQIKEIDIGKLDIREIMFEETIQKKISQICYRDGKIKELYGMIGKELISSGAYTEIVTAYYQEEKKKDRIIRE